jgi:hypothetical protein
MEKLYKWTITDFANSMLKVFYETIGKSYDNVTTNEELIKILQHLPETQKILINEKRDPIGCWSFAPLCPELIEKDKKGELIISEIKPQTIPIMIAGGKYDIHFGAICLKSANNNVTVFNKLLFSIVDVIEKYAINGVYFNEIIAKVCTDSGVSLCESIGLKYLTEHVCRDGKIYSANIKEVLQQPFTKYFTILKSLYKSNNML